MPQTRVIDLVAAARPNFMKVAPVLAAYEEHLLAASPRPAATVVVGDVNSLLESAAARLPVVLPVHPRTRARLEAAGLWTRASRAPGLRLLDPLSYREALGLMGGLISARSGPSLSFAALVVWPCSG